MNTLITPRYSKRLPFGAGASARVGGDMFATANVGSKGGRSHGAAGTAAGSTANLAVSPFNLQSKDTEMSNIQTAAAIQPAAVTINPVKVYSDEQTIAFKAADTAADVAANGAPLAFIASLLIADNYAGGVILEARGKDMARVERMTHAKAAFGSERTAFRYFSLALSYKGKAGEDVERACSMSTKDDKGKPIKSTFHVVGRATELLLGMMKSRGYHTMHHLATGLGHEKPKAEKKPADDKAKSGEGESAADGGKVKVSEADAATRTAFIVEALKAGGFTAEQHALIAAAVLAAKPADVTAEQSDVTAEQSAAA